jgi:FAD/FMN-containing dehydrogenase
VLSLGTFVDAAPYTSNYEWMKIYYQSTATRTEDYLTTEHYVFRYDRGVTNVRPKSWLGRLVLGKVMTSTQWLKLGAKLHWALAKEKPTVTLDVFVPASKVEEFMAWWQQEFGFFPLWCVPYKRVHDYEWMADEFWQKLDDDMFFDIAIYGMRQKDERNAHRVIEEKLRELGGIKTLISHNYYPEAEFWQIFNKRNYDAVKQKVDPRNLFRDLYTKTCKAAMGH